VYTIDRIIAQLVAPLKDGFFLTREYAEIELPDYDVEDFENYLNCSIPLFDFNNYYCRIGLKFSFSVVL